MQLRLYAFSRWLATRMRGAGAMRAYSAMACAHGLPRCGDAPALAGSIAPTPSLMAVLSGMSAAERQGKCCHSTYRDQPGGALGLTIAAPAGGQISAAPSSTSSGSPELWPGKSQQMNRTNSVNEVVSGSHASSFPRCPRTNFPLGSGRG